MLTGATAFVNTLLSFVHVKQLAERQTSIVQSLLTTEGGSEFLRLCSRQVAVSAANCYTLSYYCITVRNVVVVLYEQFSVLLERAHAICTALADRIRPAFRPFRYCHHCEP